MKIFNPVSLKIDGMLLSSPCVPENNCLGRHPVPINGYDGLTSGEFYSFITSINTEDTYDAPAYKRNGLNGMYYSRPTRSEVILNISGIVLAKDCCGMEQGMATIKNAYKMPNTCSESCNDFYKIEWDGACSPYETIPVSMPAVLSDGDDNTFWTGNVLNFDLGVNYSSIGGYVIDWFSLGTASGEIKIYGSNDGISFSYVGINGGYQGGWISGSTYGYRYIRIEFPIYAAYDPLGGIKVSGVSFTNMPVYRNRYYAYGQVMEKPIFNGEDCIRQEYTAKVRLKTPYYFYADKQEILGIKEGYYSKNFKYDGQLSESCCDKSCIKKSCICCDGATPILVETCTDICFPACWTIKWTGAQPLHPTYALPYVANGICLENKTTREKFCIDESYQMKQGDVITICSESRILQINGVERNDLIKMGSRFPFLTGGYNSIVLMDNTNPNIYGQTIEASVTFNAIV